MAHTPACSGCFKFQVTALLRSVDVGWVTRRRTPAWVHAEMHAARRPTLCMGSLSQANGHTPGYTAIIALIGRDSAPAKGT